MLFLRFIVLTISILMIEQSRGIEFGSSFGFGKKDVNKIENHDENKLEHESEHKVDQNKLISFIPTFDFGKNVDKNENHDENKLDKEPKNKIDQNKLIDLIPTFDFGKNVDKNENHDENKLDKEPKNKNDQNKLIDLIPIFDFGKNVDKNENHDENKIEQEPEENFDVHQSTTRLSTVEEFLKTLLIPVEAVGNAGKLFGKGVQEIISKIPDKLKDPIKGFEFSNNTNLSYGQFLNSISDRFKAIYPGTVWCGDGDRAKCDEDLGFFASTDACCRDHDKCFSNINTGEEKYGLKNVGLFTRSHRSCDLGFYNCLKAANSIIATKIGITYFNILSPQCFDEDYPIIKCNKYSGLINKKCVDYEQDLTGDKKYQWFDNPFF